MEHSCISAMANTEKKTIRPVGTFSFAGFILAAIASTIVLNSESIPAWFPGVITAVLLVSVTGIIASVVAAVPDKDRKGAQRLVAGVVIRTKGAGLMQNRLREMRAQYRLSQASWDTTAGFPPA